MCIIYVYVYVYVYIYIYVYVYVYAMYINLASNCSKVIVLFFLLMQGIRKIYEFYDENGDGKLSKKEREQYVKDALVRLVGFHFIMWSTVHIYCCFSMYMH